LIQIFEPVVRKVLTPLDSAISNRLVVDNHIQGQPSGFDNLFEKNLDPNSVARWPIAVLVCVCLGFAGFLVLYLVIRVRSTNKQRTIGDDHSQMEWDDDIGLNITVNPLDETKKNAPTTTQNNEDDDGEGGGEDDSYEPETSFKPIVQLSAVEVKTGEEDENVLFCERAKLYRFDSAANQMKERGVGEMKILQHKTTNLCRILMRREQVLKLCANHQITSQMELKPHQGSENAYVWSAMDFADGEAKHETLCIRFKSSDTAKKFVKQFNDAKQANTTVQQ